MDKHIVIVGAGLSGIYAASLLSAQGIKCTVLEARDRSGGRALTLTDSARPDLGKFDLGATWYWPYSERTITSLVNKLGLKTLDQYTKGEILSEQYNNKSPERFILPENPSAKSIRLVGGIASLIHALAASIPSDVISLNTKVTAIRLDEVGNFTIDAEQMEGNKINITASEVILALPPRIVAHNIAFTPSLPANLMNDLLNKPTWMAGQAKVVAVYEQAFWRELGLSGFVSSRLGPLQEIHDASPESGSYALFGFLGIPANVRQELGKEKVLELVIEQLVRLFGPQARNVSSILYKDWAEDTETTVDSDMNPLRSFPTYGQPPNVGGWANKLHFAGTENSPRFGGHLEGALFAAEQAVIKVVNKKI